MFFIVILASVGIFGESSIISKDMSFTESTRASNSLSEESGFASTNSVTFALKKGSD